MQQAARVSDYTAFLIIALDGIRKRDAEKLLEFIASINKVLHVVKFPSNIRVNDSAKLGPDVEVEILERSLPQEIEQKVKEREKARNQKDYALADKIRNELMAQGIVLEDTKDGVRWKIIKK